MTRPLAIVPTYLRQSQDVLLLQDCLESMRHTAGDAVDLMVIDDGSPDDELVEGAHALTVEHGGDFVAQPSNEGFSRTINIGLQWALEQDQDAILVNADIEFEDNTWLQRMRETPAAGIVGALLLYPNGTIQHAGIYFSILTRTFDHIYHYGPGNLPEAQVTRECPVTGALQFIRHSTLKAIGLYDESFRLGFEDVDYCVRAWQAGIRVIYNPGVVAYHHESFFRSRSNDRIARWQYESWMRFAEKHGKTNFAEFVPTLALGAA